MQYVVNADTRVRVGAVYLASPEAICRTGQGVANRCVFIGSFACCLLLTLQLCNRICTQSCVQLDLVERFAMSKHLARNLTLLI